VSTTSRVFTGRVAVVTGVGSGIGRALTYELAASGAVLAVSDINDAELAVTAQRARSLGATVSAHHLDVTDGTAMRKYAEEIAAHFGAVHLVINNAGVVHIGDVLGMEFSDIERVMDTNFWGVVHGTMAFLPHLIASGDGRLVNISSLFGLIPVPTQSAYVASKFAVRGFTESLRIEMLAAKLPVQVTCVHPGGVNTAIARSGTRNPGSRPESDRDLSTQKLLRMPAEKAAAIILRAASRGRPRVLVGGDARMFHLLSSITGTGWQSLAAIGFGRMSGPKSRSREQPE
jgi:NAD(P)-dependent dehydrogenase (short-subunit alcohol dehydrogenase family)